MGERLRLIRISEQLLMEMCKRYSGNLPEDVRVRPNDVRCHYDPLKRELEIIVYSEDWPRTPEGWMPELLDLEK